MNITIRRFCEEDIPFKVRWINDEYINKYLHYDLPLSEEKTLNWFRSIRDRKDRADFTILYNDRPSGLIGLLNINDEKLDAEYYVCLGGKVFEGKGIALKATNLLIKHAWDKYGLSTIYLYTEVENLKAQKLFERCGFIKDRLIKNHIYYRGRHIDRYLYRLNVRTYINKLGEGI